MFCCVCDINLPRMTTVASAGTPCRSPGGACGRYYNESHRSSINFNLVSGNYRIEAPEGIVFTIYEDDYPSRLLGTFKNGDVLHLSEKRVRMLGKYYAMTKKYNLYIGDPQSAGRGFAIVFYSI